MDHGSHQLKDPLILVDGHNLLWRAAFGFPARIRSRSGSDRTATFGFFALLRAAAKEVATSCEWIVCFDGEDGAEGRRDADGRYKINRSVIDHSPLKSLPDVKAGLDLNQIVWIEERKHEADDIIATLVAKYAGRHILILSTDKDYYQLLTDSVYVLNTSMKGGSTIVMPEDVLRRFGVSPSQWCDFQALVGDPADNLPGVRGVGLRTAAKLLAGGASLEQLGGLGRLTGRTGALVQTSWSQVLLTRELLRLRRDVEVAEILSGPCRDSLPNPADVLERLGLWR